ncbi:MAG TPA: hypothetical protein VHO92_02400, partial [Methanobacterium sp.]|nr:hypothetical protein [Methanobacterium sp.]
AENNWWGTNNPVWNNLIDGFAQPTNWVILSVKATPNSINNTQTSTVTADFNHINGGSDLVGGHIPDGIPVSFSLTNGPLGTLTLPTACTTNGTASMLFTATSVGVQDVNATLDDQSVTTNITINPASNLYLNITSNNNNPKLGQTFTITYKLGNYGPDTATNVMITIPLPEGFLVSQITGDGNWTISGNTILWTLKNVPKGDPYLYVSGWSNHAGIIVFSSSISSETYNINTNSVTPLTINTIETAHAASKTEKTNKTIGMQDTGLPIAGLILSILATFGGLVAPRRK